MDGINYYNRYEFLKKMYIEKTHGDGDLYLCNNDGCEKMHLESSKVYKEWLNKYDIDLLEYEDFVFCDINDCDTHYCVNCADYKFYLLDTGHICCEYCVTEYEGKEVAASSGEIFILKIDDKNSSSTNYPELKFRNGYSVGDEIPEDDELEDDEFYHLGIKWKDVYDKYGRHTGIRRVD